MKGDRGTRGIIHRNKKHLFGQDYLGSATGSVTPWGGSAGAAPTVGVGPTITLPMDDDDDGDATAIVSSTSKRGKAVRRAIDSTKTRLRTQLKTLANHIAWLMEAAAGIRSIKALVVDGVGGATAAGEAGFVTVNGVAQPRIVASAYIGGAGVLTAGVGLDAVAPVDHSAGTGKYTLKLAAAVANAAKLIVLVNGDVNYVASRWFGPLVQDTQHVYVETRDMSGGGTGVLANMNFYITILELP